MHRLSSVVEFILKLKDASTTYREELERITFEGSNLRKETAGVIRDICSAFNEEGIQDPVILIEDTPVDSEELSDINESNAQSWRVVIGKRELAEILEDCPSRAAKIFFSYEGFEEWLSEFDPLSCTEEIFSQNSEEATIYVAGLSAQIGGPRLKIVPIEASINGLTATAQSLKFPTPEEVSIVTHNLSGAILKPCPANYYLNWGDLEHPLFSKLRRQSALVASACLLNDIFKDDEGNYCATLKGTKKLKLRISLDDENITYKELSTLYETISWVYSERVETRLQLVLDRLTIDLQAEQSYLVGLKKNLEDALHQARDSYTFVILERKDAYYREVREVMKDMKAQADYYSNKVRELVNALARDALGILAFIGFSVIMKLDMERVGSLVTSGAFLFFIQILCAYLFVSGLIQVISSIRDENLTYGEGQHWLKILQNYVSTDEGKRRFTEPIDRRRMTLYIAINLTVLAYLLLIIFVWNLPTILSGLVV